MNGNGIRDLIEKYGYPISEEGGVKLLKQKKPSFDWLKTPRLFTPEEAKEYGIELEEGWMLKLTPAETAMGFTPSLVNPQGWEILEDQTWLSPEGDKYAPDDLEAMLAESYYPSEKDYAGLPPMTPERWATETKAFEFSQVFGDVFPDRDIFELVDWLGESDDNIDEFLFDIKEVGRTPETETLLKSIYTGMDEAQLGEFFGEFIPSEPFTYDLLKSVVPESFQSQYEDITRAIESWDYGIDVERAAQKYLEFRFATWSEAQIKAVIPSMVASYNTKWKEHEPGLGTMAMGSFAAGWGDMAHGMAWVADKVGMTGEWAQDLREWGEAMRYMYIPSSTEEFSWRSLKDPEWWATTVTRTVPMILSLIPAAVVGAMGGTYIAGAAGLGKLATAILAGIGSAVVARPMESALEAANTYERAIEMGMSEEEADAAANQTFGENLSLAGMDAAQWATAFFPIKGGGTAVKQILLKRILATGVKVVGVGIMESAEEGLQDLIQRRALGEEVALDPRMTEAMALGFIFGTGMGGTGSVMDVLVGRIKNDMTPDLLADFEGFKSDGLAKGLNEDQAEIDALNKIAATPEGRASIENSMRDIVEKVKEIEPEVKEPQIDVFMEIPESVKLLDPIMAENWQRTLAQKIGKVPVAKKIVELGLGKRILVKRQSEALEDIAGRAKFIQTEVNKRGENAQALVYWQLFNIHSNPVKLFGFNKDAISTKVKRLTKASDGTLEDIFTHPEKYELNPQQMQYVTRVHELNTAILNMLKKEGIAPDIVGKDWWLHRVVVGKFDPNGELVKVRGKPGVKYHRIGGKASFDMHRKAPTMAEGISWGVQYGKNPAEAVSTYMEEAFKKIGDERAVKYMAEHLEPLAKEGKLPSEELLRRYPEVVERAVITAEELADAKAFIDKVNRAIRGERLSEQTLRAIERRFPDMGRRLRGLIEAPIKETTQLRDLLNQSNSIIKKLQSQLKAKEKPDVVVIKKEAEEAIPMPDKQKLAEAFRIMCYEERLAFRSTMESQLGELGQILMEQDSELKGIEEFLRTDPVATFRGHIGKKPVSLMNILIKGQFPESFTIKQAEMLMMGRHPKTIIEGRVPLEVVLDNLAEHFNMSEQELIDYVESIYQQKITASDLRSLLNWETGRAEAIKSMLAILDTVDTHPDNIPEPEFAEPYVAPEMKLPFGVEGLPLAPLSDAYKTTFPLGELHTFYKAMTVEPAAREVQAFGEGFYVSPTKGGAEFWGTDVRSITANIKKALIVPADSDLFTVALNAGYEGKEPTMARIIEWAKKEGYDAIIGKSVHEGHDHINIINREVISAIPKAEPGMPEAGVQKDIFGYEHPVFPKGKGQVTQLSMDDYKKLVEVWQKAGLPEDALPVAMKPKVEGVEGLEAETTFVKVEYPILKETSATDRKAQLIALRKEADALLSARKMPFYQARHERALRMQEVRQPGIDEGYIMHPFAQGKIYDQDFIDAFNKYFGHDSGLKALSVTADSAGILRIMKAALDFSQPLIQGMTSWGLAHAYLVINPKIGSQLMGAWYKTFFMQIGAFFNPSITAHFMEARKDTIKQRIAFGGSSRAVYMFQEMQAVVGKGAIGRAGETLLGKIPLDPYHRAEVSFFTGGEMVRDIYWDILSPDAIARGQEFELAQYLDKLTGISDPRAMGVPMTVRQLEQSFIWFSSAYTRSYLTLVADIFRGKFTGSMARKSLAGFIVAGAVYFTAIQYAICQIQGKDDDDTWETIQKGFGIYIDPITGAWDWRPTAAMMSLKVGDNYFGVGGGIYGLLRLLGNIVATVKEVGERDVIDLIRIMKHGSLNKRDNPFISWWYARSSALLSPIYEMATKRDFLGYPIETPMDYARYIISIFEPIWVEQSINPLIPGMAGDREVPESALETASWIAGEVFGLRVNPEYSWQKFYNKANEYIPNIPESELDERQKQAWRDGKLRWSNLTDIQKINLLYRYPELYDAYELAQADSDMRATPHWKDWESRQNEERDIYYERGKFLVEQLLTGKINSREFRELWSEAGQNYGITLDSIAKEPSYKVIYDFFDRQAEKGDKYLFQADVALAEYIQVVFEDYTDAKGDYDWDAKDRAIDGFIDKWGNDWYEIIREMYAKKRLMDGLEPILVRMSDDKDKLGRDYWRLPYKPISDMDEADEAKGNIPAEYHSLWAEYQALETEEEREDFLSRYPKMSKDWRQEYRLNNPEADAMLAMWGYGGKLQSMKAYEKLVQWGRELGIPLEQMGLGLPPHSLIEDYFELNKVVAKTSGSSAEAKLFKLEHPDYLAWGLDQGIWKDDLSDESIEALRISVEWSEMDDNYNAVPEEDRSEFLDANIEYHRARRCRDAYEIDGFPEARIYDYAEWYVSLPKKSDDAWFEEHPNETFYGDDWWLQEHSDFHNIMVELGIWKELRDFTKVPTRDVFKKYQRYVELDTGKPRLWYRCRNKDLDDWLVISKGLTPAYGKDRCMFNQ